MLDYSKILSKTVVDLKPSGIRKFFDLLGDMNALANGKIRISDRINADLLHGEAPFR